MTTTIRSDDPTGWTKVPHSLTRDPRISHGARGLAVQLLSHADGYKSDAQTLAQYTADGRDAIRGYLAELRQYGYLVRQKVRGKDGKLTTRSVLYDVPQQTELPVDEPPRGRQHARSEGGKFGKTDATTSTNTKNSQVTPSGGKPACRSDQAQRAEKSGSPEAGNPPVGATSGNTASPQVEPTSGNPATRCDQGEQGIVAGGADRRETRLHIEDQGEDQKKISQSERAHERDRPLSAGRDGLTDPPSRAHTQATERTARRTQCRRELHQAYGLNDAEADQAMAVCDLRSPTPIRSYVAYLRGMDADDRADIIEAIQLGDRRRQAADAVTEPEPAPEPPPAPPADPEPEPGRDPAAIAAEAAAARAANRAFIDGLKDQTTTARLQPEPASRPAADLPVCSNPECDVVLDANGKCFVCQPEPTRIPARTA